MPDLTREQVEALSRRSFQGGWTLQQVAAQLLATMDRLTAAEAVCEAAQVVDDICEAQDGEYRTIPRPTFERVHRTLAAYQAAKETK